MNRKAAGLIFIERRPGYKAGIQDGLKGQLKRPQEFKKNTSKNKKSIIRKSHLK